VTRLRAALNLYIKTGERPDPATRRDGTFAYPEIRLRYDGGRDPGPLGRSFGRLQEPGDYAIAVTQPVLFAPYLAQQIDLLIEDYGVTVEAGVSRTEIPYNYVLDAGDDLDLTGASPVELSRIFPSTELSQIGDELADGLWLQEADAPRPLALFDAPRVDFSLARLRHYTGTPPGHVQDYILFTNYHRYVDEFVHWAIDQLDKDGRYTMLSGAGGVEIRAGDPDPRQVIADSAWRKHQMPAYHLVGHHSGQYRRRPVQRQDDHRSSGGDAAGGLADDRPLRRPAPQPADRRLCAGPRLSARRPCPRQRAAARNPDPGDRRGPAGDDPRGGDRLGPEHGAAEAAHAHRYRRHLRRP
jgi:AMP nucleosidase